MIKLCATSDIGEGEAKGFRIQDRNLFVVHKDGQFFAYENACPHLGIELEWQEHQFLDHLGEYIQCASHGALFTIQSGECISGPCQGQALKPVALRIENHQLVI